MLMHKSPALSTAVRRRTPPLGARPRRDVAARANAGGAAAAATTATTTAPPPAFSSSAAQPLSQAVESASADAAAFLAQERGQLRELAEQTAAAITDGSAAEAASEAAARAAAPFAVFGGQAVALNVLFCGAVALVAYALLFKAPKQ